MASACRMIRLDGVRAGSPPPQGHNLREHRQVAVQRCGGRSKRGRICDFKYGNRLCGQASGFGSGVRVRPMRRPGQSGGKLRRGVAVGFCELCLRQTNRVGKVSPLEMHAHKVGPFDSRRGRTQTTDNAARNDRSDHDGEVSNAARLASHLVRSKGMVWGDVIPPALPSPELRPDPWGDVLRELEARGAALPARGRAPARQERGLPPADFPLQQPAERGAVDLAARPRHEVPARADHLSRTRPLHGD